MGQMVFITGGSRSGKSSFAQQRCEEHPGELLYIAPAESDDDEMLQRVRLNQETRGERWHLMDEPLWLSDKLVGAATGRSALLLDCVTLWVTNLYSHFNEKSRPVLAEIDRFIELAWQLDEPLYLVSNELGSGIDPENQRSRQFRDLTGIVNQRLAAAADEAWFVVSGLPLQLK